MNYKVCCLGVDVSKATLDIACCVDISKSRFEHIKVDNSASGFKELCKWMKKQTSDLKLVRLCMEYTGLYAHELRLWLEAEGIMYFMVNPIKMHKYEPPENVKGLNKIKSDEVDSYRISLFCIQNHNVLTPSKLPSGAYFKLKRLLAERIQYVKQSVLYKQQLHDISRFDTEASQLRKEAALLSITNNIKQTDKEIDGIIRSDPQILQNYELLLSIIGIGRVNALTTIILTENFQAFTDPRRYANYIGVAPFIHESGTSVKKATRVSKAGFSKAKADLSIAVCSAIQNDPQIKAYWLRKKAEGKPSGVVLNAIKFKIVLRMFAVIKRQKTYVKMDAYKQ